MSLVNTYDITTEANTLFSNIRFEHYSIDVADNQDMIDMCDAHITTPSNYITYTIRYRGEITKNDDYNPDIVATSDKYIMRQFHNDIFKYFNNAIIRVDGLLYPMIVVGCDNDINKTIIGYPEVKCQDTYTMYQPTSISKSVSGHIQLKIDSRQVKSL